MRKARLAAKTASLISASPPTPPNAYKQYLPFWPYKVVALLAWGFSASVERLPSSHLLVHLPSWARELGVPSQVLRDALKEAARQGMITMKEDGIMKALKGLVSVEEVLRVVEE